MSDPFFTKTKCDRCGGSLEVRTMSWFTTETICVDCCDKEDILRAELRTKEIRGTMEGCGFIPDPAKVETTH